MEMEEMDASYTINTATYGFSVFLCTILGMLLGFTTLFIGENVFWIQPTTYTWTVGNFLINTPHDNTQCCLVSGGVFYCANPTHCSLSPVSSPWRWLPPLWSTLASLLPNSSLPTMYLPVFSPSNYADCSVNPQIDFLGVQNGLMLIQLCSRNETSPGAPYYSAILTPWII